MYKVVDWVPKNWDSRAHGKALMVLADEWGGQSVIGIDDHCFVLWNGSDDRKFGMSSWWYREAAIALAVFLIANPDFKP